VSWNVYFRTFVTLSETCNVTFTHLNARNRNVGCGGQFIATVLEVHTRWTALTIQCKQKKTDKDIFQSVCKNMMVRIISNRLWACHVTPGAKEVTLEHDVSNTVELHLSLLFSLRLLTLLPVNLFQSPSTRLVLISFFFTPTLSIPSHLVFPRTFTVKFSFTATEQRRSHVVWVPAQWKSMARRENWFRTVCCLQAGSHAARQVESLPNRPQVETEAKAVPLHTTRRLWGGGYSSYSFSTSTLDGGWVVSVTPRPRFSPVERTPGTHCTKGWVGPRAGVDTEAGGKILSPLPGIERRSPGRPALSQTLYWLVLLSSPSQGLMTRFYFFLITPDSSTRAL
jgi:hypothetical protein